ncbi:hypothetical protein ASG11_15535 [Sphingomonas sp. Leaf357]|uniref:helix-turn-helix domain-containing protein n=1 Tax=Sphingomonas sp. Leaf357 TaxID=1736350 RepID=UPI0006F9A9E7|nr:helix-turn-helix domain-containing protein [Sphingomonas sp. Leaf357]KQS02190.1 hypothetical protein ASG11_15535 [Sphingomonas sp. Leaf357]
MSKSTTCQSVRSPLDEPRGQSARLAYSVTEACTVTGLGKTTLYSLLKGGRLPSCKIGNRRLIRRDDLEALITVEDGGQGEQPFF